MNARDLNKRVDVYSVAPVPDGYGGNTVAETLESTRWAKVEPLSPGSADKTYGLQDPVRSVRFTFRKDGLTLTPAHFLKYRGQKYTIASGPYELKFDNRFIEVVCGEG